MLLFEVRDFFRESYQVGFGGRDMGFGFGWIGRWHF
jgi:hypothetical protein